MKEYVFYTLVFVVLTIALSSAITSVLTKTYYEYEMYVGPGVYRFYPNGSYSYLPGGPYATLEANVVEVNGSVYTNNVTIEPGFYDIVVVEPSGTFFSFEYAVALVLSALISLVIVAMLDRLLRYLAERAR